MSYTTSTDLRTEDEIAEIVRMTVHYLRKDRRSGNPRFPYIRLGRAVRYRLSEVERVLAAHQVGDTAGTNRAA